MTAPLILECLPHSQTYFWLVGEAAWQYKGLDVCLCIVSRTLRCSESGFYNQMPGLSNWFCSTSSPKIIKRKVWSSSGYREALQSSFEVFKMHDWKYLLGFFCLVFLKIWSNVEDDQIYMGEESTNFRHYLLFCFLINPNWMASNFSSQLPLEMKESLNRGGDELL